METPEDSDITGLLISLYRQNPRKRNADAAVMEAKEGTLRIGLRNLRDLASGC